MQPQNDDGTYTIGTTNNPNVNPFTNAHLSATLDESSNAVGFVKIQEKLFGRRQSSHSNSSFIGPNKFLPDGALLPANVKKEAEKEIENDEHSYNSLLPMRRRISRTVDGECKPLLESQNAGDVAEDKQLQQKKTKFTRRQLLILISLCILHFSTLACFSLVAPFYPTEMLRKGGTATLAGLVFSIYELAVFFSSPIYGRIIVYTGVRKMLLSGCLVVGFSMLVFGTLDRLPAGWPFIAASLAVRIVEGLGVGAYYTASFSTFANEFPDDLGFTYGLLKSFLGVGMTFGPAIGGFLYQLGGFSLPFWTLGGVFIAVSMIVYCIIPSVKVEPRTTNQTFWALFKLAPMALAAMTISSASLSIGFLEATLAIHTLPIVGSEAGVGLIILLSGLTEGIAAPMMGKLIDHGFPAKYLMICGFLLNCVAFGIIGPSPLFFGGKVQRAELWMAIIGVTIQGLGVGCMLSPPFVDSTQEAIRGGFPRNIETFGLVSGMFASTFAMGAFTGPLVGGWMLDTWGFAWASTIIGFVQLIGGIVITIYVICYWMPRRNC